MDMVGLLEYLGGIEAALYSRESNLSGRDVRRNSSSWVVASRARVFFGGRASVAWDNVLAQDAKRW
jgi:hypothetical protein